MIGLVESFTSLEQHDISVFVARFIVSIDPFHSQRPRKRRKEKSRRRLFKQRMQAMHAFLDILDTLVIPELDVAKLRDLLSSERIIHGLLMPIYGTSDFSLLDARGYYMDNYYSDWNKSIVRLHSRYLEKYQGEDLYLYMKQVYDQLELIPGFNATVRREMKRYEVFLQWMDSFEMSWCEYFDSKFYKEHWNKREKRFMNPRVDDRDYMDYDLARFPERFVTLVERLVASGGQLRYDVPVTLEGAIRPFDEQIVVDVVKFSKWQDKYRKGK